MATRTVIEVIPARPSRDGDGVAIRRVAGMRHAGLDPFLMLDELQADRREDFGGGFPPHPHRGMQTLTYMKHGGIIHEDSRGNRGEVRGGGAQWMSAGRGIVHSEMPTQDSQGLHGFQLWINLAARDKWSEPTWRDVPAASLVHLDATGVEADAIAGDWSIDGHTVSGPLQQVSASAAVLDLRLEAGHLATVAAAPGETLLAFLYRGSVGVAQDPVVAGTTHGATITSGHLLVTSREAADWQVQAGKTGANLLFLRGRPLREPVAHYGPFVMNTAEEIEQAIRDYQAGEFG
ncbi:pirin family protein [Haliea atlantica]